ncbi:MAG TPA: helix-turn-helix domain-containing protein [Burkholderiaceae bacterium]
MRGSTTGRPIMALLDLLGRRWVLRIMWELRGGALTFRELQQHCGGMSPTVLNQRLKDLREAGLVELGEEGGYIMSLQGESLTQVLLPLVHWSEQWQTAPDRRE